MAGRQGRGGAPATADRPPDDASGLRGEAEALAQRRAQTAVFVLLGLGLLPILGRFLSPTLAWGVHLTGYLPAWAWAISILAWGTLLLAPVASRLDAVLFGERRSLSSWLFGRSPLPLVVAPLAGLGLFVLLRAATHLLGDGVLVGELVARGAEFRGHDAMDYLLHRLVYGAVADGNDPALSFRLYAIGSWLAGLLAIFLALRLLRGSPMPAATRTVLFAIWLAAPSTLLFCGYVESYGFVTVALLGFLWSGAMAQRGRAPAWLPGLFFGLALFFHTIALVAAPALLWLALRPGPERAPRGKWLAQVIVPAVAVPLVAVAAHLAAGYDGAWFETEFLKSSNQQKLLVPLTGPHGFLSLLHVKDLANWLLLVTPVTGSLIVLGILPRMARGRRATPREARADLPFLWIHTVAFLLAFALLDRKLGMARDWDLLVPHAVGLAWIAARLWEEEVATQPAPAGRAPVGPARAPRIALPSLRVAAVSVALLLAWPWFAVNASRDASLARFDEMRADFAPAPRAYAAEELGKYYRDRGDYQKALPLYEETVRINPRNARTRVLLGGLLYLMGRRDDAEREYDAALDIDPDSWLAMQMKARLAFDRKDYAGALPLLRRAAPMTPDDPGIWSSYGYAALESGLYEEALTAFQQAGKRQTDVQTLYYAGIAAAYLRRWDVAIRLLDAAASRSSGEAPVLHALAAAREARVAEASPPLERAAAQEEIRAARELAARAVAASHPADPKIEGYLEHLDAVLAGREAPANSIRP
ncbi:MAG: tetratricopeptide repeat protein [Candidatus Eisenbacteria bacterium]